jgi:hypothetical protein
MREESDERHSTAAFRSTSAQATGMKGAPMRHNAMPSDSELDALMVELLTPRASTNRASSSRGHNGESALTDALTTALARALSQASPLDRALFAEALAPAVVDALTPAVMDVLAPALADALTPALATALESLFAAKKLPQEAPMSGEGPRSQTKK